MAGEEYLLALGHMSQETEETNQQTAYAKKRGIWSGLKQIFHGGRQGPPPRPPTGHRMRPTPTHTNTAAFGNRRSMSRSDMQSLSYSCLGQPRGREEEDDGDEEEEEQYMREQARRLSRNLSLSHESVFQIDSHSGQENAVSLCLSPASRTYSSHAIAATAAGHHHHHHHRTSGSAAGTSGRQTTAVPILGAGSTAALQNELAAVLRQRQDRTTTTTATRTISKRSLDFTDDDEDLGLPKSLQNSPGDFSEEGRPSNWAAAAAAASRHHSSCSDNSLLSLDSTESHHHHHLPPMREPRPTAAQAPGAQYSDSDGQLSHAAARHKMAVRPRRNHAGKKPRRVLQGLTEETSMEEENVSAAGHWSEVVDTTEGINSSGTDVVSEPPDKAKKSKAKSRSLDVSFLGARDPGTAATMPPLERAEGRQSKTKGEGMDSKFLSRLFGSKRAKASKASPAPQPPMASSASNHVDDEWSHRPPRTSVSSYELRNGDNQMEWQKHQSSTENAAVSVRMGGSRSYHKQKPPPPPPSSPPPPGAGSGFFTRSNSSGSAGGGLDCAQDFPSLPPLGGASTMLSASAVAKSSDIILKKNRSLGSVLESRVGGHEKFHASVENWSFANEGLKRSIGSLADRPIIMSSHSNESLKTITSLLEEPDVLVQTRVSDRTQVATPATLSATSFEQPARDFKSLPRAATEPQLEIRSENSVKDIILNWFSEEEKEEVVEAGKEVEEAQDDAIHSVDEEPDDGEDVSDDMVRCNSNYDVIFTAQLYEQESNGKENVIGDVDDFVLSSEPSSFEMMMTSSESRDFDDVEQDSQLKQEGERLALAHPPLVTEPACNNNTNTNINQASQEDSGGEEYSSSSGTIVGNVLLDESPFPESEQTLSESGQKDGDQPDTQVHPQDSVLLHPQHKEDDLYDNSPCVNINEGSGEDSTESTSHPNKNETNGKEVALGILPENAFSVCQSTELPSNPPSPSEQQPPVLPAQPASILAPPQLFRQQSMPEACRLEETRKTGGGEPPAKERPDVGAGKPVPAPRHFFLRPIPGAIVAGEENSETAQSELQAVWATRRSRSMRSLVCSQDVTASVTYSDDSKLEQKEISAVPQSQKADASQEPGDQVELTGPEASDQPEASDLLINVKERARSFSSSLQNGLANFGPKPFRPPSSSILQEIRNSKPVNIPPKPKVTVVAKPVPAPRQLHSLSSSALEGVVTPAERLPASKSSSGIGLSSQLPLAKGSSSHGAGLQPSPLPTTLTVPPSPSPSPLSSNMEKALEPENRMNDLPLQGNQLEDIHVRKLVDNFQSGASLPRPPGGQVLNHKKEEPPADKIIILSPSQPKPVEQQRLIVAMVDNGETTTDPLPLSPTEMQLRRPGKSPEKPARRSRDKSSERTPTGGGDSGSNVMSIVSRLNALAL